MWVEAPIGGDDVKRWIFIILLFLLLGLIVNVAVAWGCAALRPDPLPRSITNHGESVLRLTYSGGTSDLQLTYSDPQFGWPMRSMYLNRSISAKVSQGQPVQISFRNENGAMPMPCHPLWPGFAVNTLLYAALLWLAFCGPPALRRHIRVKGGRCPKCGYDLRGAPGSGCPECGWNRPPTPPPEMESGRAVDAV